MKYNQLHMGIEINSRNDTLGVQTQSCSQRRVQGRLICGVFNTSKLGPLSCRQLSDHSVFTLASFPALTVTHISNPVTSLSTFPLKSGMEQRAASPNVRTAGLSASTFVL
ncbi:Hypothetical predicted protein [Xyrichtys novacula]|uniref:Uncharacterized protein n=1 Tax=Xyrichtys novacula TaxID=13765 RepID=A0AAV1GKC8_XYRNO|nr:Hypothetical predicted protein [Xyrichtys novacula]